MNHAVIETTVSLILISQFLHCERKTNVPVSKTRGFIEQRNQFSNFDRKRISPRDARFFSLWGRIRSYVCLLAYWLRIILFFPLIFRGEANWTSIKSLNGLFGNRDDGRNFLAAIDRLVTRKWSDPSAECAYSFLARDNCAGCCDNCCQVELFPLSSFVAPSIFHDHELACDLTSLYGNRVHLLIIHFLFFGRLWTNWLLWSYLEFFDR